MIGLSLILIAASKCASVEGGCYPKSSSHVVETTKSLVVKKSKLIIPVSELPTKSGVHACVRLIFEIDNNGKAASIAVAEHHGSFLLNMNAVTALKKYVFVRRDLIPYSKKMKIYSLVFSAVVDKVPPFPDAGDMRER